MRLNRTASPCRWLAPVLTLALAVSALAQPYPRITEEAWRARLPFFDHNPKLPLDARVVDQRKRDGTVRDKVVFRTTQGFLVPGFLELPTTGTKPYPVVLLLHGWSGSKQVWWEDEGIHTGGLMRKALLGAGYAVFALDAAAHGERAAEIGYRSVNTPDNPFSYAEISIQTTKDYRRAIDYLATRPELDIQRLGLVGYSMGGMDSFYLLSVEPRIRAAVACVPPMLSEGYGPASPIDYSWGVKGKALLLLMGSQDDMYNKDKVNASYHDYIETEHSRLIWYDRGHGLKGDYVPDALNWIEKHLGTSRK